MPLKELIKVTIDAGSIDLNDIDGNGKEVVLSALYNGAAAMKHRGLEKSEVTLTFKTLNKE
jgi:hypothetical protein